MSESDTSQAAGQASRVGADARRSSPSKSPLSRGYPDRSATMNGPLYRQSSENTMLVRRIKKTSETPPKQLLRWFVENQVGLSCNLLALLFLAHGCMPKVRGFTSKFFTLPYYNPESGKYGLGQEDAYLISFCLILFTGLRAAVMEHVLAPFAQTQGITKKKPITRFCEQAWLLVYYLCFWPLGMYFYVKSPYFLDLQELWTDWPGRELSGLMKTYILTQLAFWIQQVVVLHIEERRKDHWQMLGHHIITISLIYGCYRYHFTAVGNLILVLMDIVDIFFPLAKCLKYAGYTTLCDIAFGLFMVSWIFARHIFYMMVFYSILVDTDKVIPTACYSGRGASMIGPYSPPKNQNSSLHILEPLWSSEGQICWSGNLKWCFLSLLAGLQFIMLIWFRSIVRVALRVIRGDGADDVRSDDEGEEEEEEEVVYEAVPALEQEVGVEEIDLKNWERRAGVKRQVATTGVSLPSHSDRKELLGRIGCEKQVE